MTGSGFHPAAVSFDIEDWFHPELLRGHVAPDDSRSVVRQGTHAILLLLERRRVPATFFVLGDVARRHPDLVRAIEAGGHEIACHGMTHRPLWNLDRESFRGELRDFRAAIRAALGHDRAVGFRAPTFSLDRSTAWALDVLSEEGFRWDSSVFPLRVGLYGVPGAPLGIYRPSRSNLARHDPRGALVEFPVAVGALGPLRLPVAGGFYLRALPLALIQTTLDRIARRRPFALYLHPWECAPDLPRVRLAPADAFVTYCNLGTVMRKLDALLGRYAFMTMSGILERYAPLAPAA
ncbi:MAG: polysaccharide deacetylase family protein [Candidatus Eisenbacteria bacterium]|nr:polysaccharide deacetylase family protein [Candidatus Eisenbacteria bacterium]